MTYEWQLAVTTTVMQELFCQLYRALMDCNVFKLLQFFCLLSLFPGPLLLFFDVVAVKTLRFSQNRLAVTSNSVGRRNTGRRYQ